MDLFRMRYVGLWKVDDVCWIQDDGWIRFQRFDNLEQVTLSTSMSNEPLSTRTICPMSRCPRALQRGG